MLLSAAGLAQAPKPQGAQNEVEQRGAGFLAPPPPQEKVTWEQMQRMELEAVYAGPMKDTTIQRWRDPSLNVVCYLYVPFTAQHSLPTDTGYVQYGANNIGTISCLPVLGPPPAKPAGRAPSAKATPAPPRGHPLKTSDQ